MSFELQVLVSAFQTLRTRLRWRWDEVGMTTETVIITALLAGLALAVGAIITVKVMTKASSIQTN